MKFIENLAKGSLVLLFGIFLSKLLSYIYRVIVARYLGSSDYGLLILGLAVFGVANLIASLGMRSGVLRYVSFYLGKKDYKKVKGVILSSLKLTFILGVFLGVILFFVSDFLAINLFHNSKLIILLKILAVGLPFVAMLDILLGVFLGFQKPKYEVINDKVIRSIVQILVTLFLIMLGYNVLGAAWGFVIGVITSTLLSLFILEFKLLKFLKSFVNHIKMTKELVNFSWPLVLTLVSGLIISYIDTFMLGYFKTASEVGIYNVALPTSALLLILPAALFVNMLSAMTNLYAQKKLNELKKVYNTVVRWLFLINFPIFLFIIFFSEGIITSLFGKEYLSANLALIVLSLGYLFHSLISYPNISVLEVFKRTKTILLINVIITVLNIIINYLLIPEYGIIGAAIGTGGSFILGAILFFLITKDIAKLSPKFISYWKIFLASIISIFVVYLLSTFLNVSLMSLIILFIALIVIYNLLMFLIKGFTKEDLIAFKAVLTGVFNR
ncbi:MAG: flippase [Candidatus Woesearchaeota archaeon]|nr:MAG: flippase [Candidatus Woesearchaeota archaeon]